MNYLKLGVVALCFGCLIYTVTTGAAPSGPVEGFSNPEFNGMLGFAFWMGKMLGYAFLVAVASITLWFVCSALNVTTDVFGKISGGLRSFYKDMTQDKTPDPLDKVIAKESGKDVTVLDFLKKMNGEIQSIKERTAHIEPPPPPKTREEQLEEELAEAKKQLAKKEAATT